MKKPYFKILNGWGGAWKNGPSIIIPLCREMTDKEKLTNLLTEFGVGFSEEFTINNHGTEIYCIECMSDNAKITGYNNFYTSFVFDKDGKFIEMGAWE